MAGRKIIELPALADGEKRAGKLGVRLHGIEDPYLTDEINAHATPEYRAGLERLLAFDFEVRNRSTSKNLQFSAGKIHLIDDQGYMHEDLGLDSRNKAPRLVETVLPPSLSARGWVTWALPRARQAVRLQLFTGYLMGKTAVFELPTVPADHWDRHLRSAERRQRELGVQRRQGLREAALFDLQRRTESTEPR